MRNLSWEVIKSLSNSRGPKGDTGDKGPKGDTGLRGIVGESGGRGPQGEKGDQGAAGPQGDLGPKGPKGDTGLTGDRGPKGDKGLTGDKGPKGDTGLTGDRGPKGDTGPKGDKGLDASDIDLNTKGLQGDKGPKGLQGDKGPKGLQGDKGPKGDQGPVGIVTTGTIYSKGPTGNKGPQGDKGLTGDAGIPGGKGAIGDKGPPGFSGQQGDNRDVIGKIELKDWILGANPPKPYWFSNFNNGSIDLKPSFINNLPNKDSPLSTKEPLITLSQDKLDIINKIGELKHHFFYQGSADKIVTPQCPSDTTVVGTNLYLGDTSAQLKPVSNKLNILGSWSKTARNNIESDGYELGGFIFEGKYYDGWRIYRVFDVPIADATTDNAVTYNYNSNYGALSDSPIVKFGFYGYGIPYINRLTYIEILGEPGAYDFIFAPYNNARIKDVIVITIIKE